MNNTDLIYSLAIGIIVLALTYSSCYHRLNFEKRVSIVIAIAFGVIVYVFLQENPQILANTVTRIALALIGAVIALTIWIRRNVP